MLDVAIRGIGDHWNDVILPDLDYLVIENTLGKFGERVENFNSLPLNVQSLVGRIYRPMCSQDSPKRIQIRRTI